MLTLFKAFLKRKDWIGDKVRNQFSTRDEDEDDEASHDKGKKRGPDKSLGADLERQPTKRPRVDVEV